MQHLFYSTQAYLYLFGLLLLLLFFYELVEHGQHKDF